MSQHYLRTESIKPKDLATTYCFYCNLDEYGLHLSGCPFFRKQHGLLNQDFGKAFEDEEIDSNNTKITSTSLPDGVDSFMTEPFIFPGG